MNRLAMCAVVLTCLASFACKTANVPAPAPPPPPPPPPTSAFPAGCTPVAGALVTIPVDKSASVAPADECPVLDLNAVVQWQGGTDVKTLLVGWKPKSAGCDAPPKNPTCNDKGCSFDSSTVVSKVDLVLCYSVGVIDISGGSAIKDPRLIIRGRA